MDSWSVYMHTSPNGKVYIGITSIDVEDRWKGGHGYYRQAAFFNAIKKYGWKNFKHEVLFTGLTQEEAEAKEVELIKKYRATERAYGYNRREGGGATGRQMQETKEKISAALRGERNPMYGKKPWNYRIPCSEQQKQRLSEVNAIAVICVETGELFQSAREASRILNISYKNISHVLRGDRKRAGGYTWIYANEVEK